MFDGLYRTATEGMCAMLAKQAAKILYRSYLRSICAVTILILVIFFICIFYLVLSFLMACFARGCVYVDERCHDDLIQSSPYDSGTGN